MVKFSVVVVIPAFNEESTISNVVKSIRKYATIVVVNDASTDKTSHVSKDSGAIVVNHKTNKGYDGAINSGFIKAKELGCDAIITFDADGQHKPEMLNSFIENLKNGVDLVLGVRPNSARFSEFIFSLYTKIRFNWSDPLCGMKGYSIKLYNQKGCFDTYKSIGTDLALFGLKNGFSNIQIPIEINKRSDNPRFSSSIKSNIYILLALFRSLGSHNR